MSNLDYLCLMATSKQIAVAHAKFQAVIDPMNAPSDTQIVKEIYGYDQENAEAHAHQVVESSGVQSEFRRLLEAKIPDKKITTGLNMLTSAKDPVLDRKTGKVIAKTPNHAVRLATFQTVMKAKGLTGDVDVQIDARTLNIGGNDTHSQSKLSAIAERLDILTAKLSSITITGSSKLNTNPSSDAVNT